MDGAGRIQELELANERLHKAWREDVSEVVDLLRVWLDIYLAGDSNGDYGTANEFGAIAEATRRKVDHFTG